MIEYEILISTHKLLDILDTSHVNERKLVAETSTFSDSVSQPVSAEHAAIGRNVTTAQTLFTTAQILFTTAQILEGDELSFNPAETS